ncbi:MAG: hypothetical protein OER77_05665 [Myxococcales bacterium]|nr:hypothetical protein [Myxococcales bacterium]
MTDTDPVLAIWADCDPSMRGWAEMKKAIDAYRAGDIVTAISRAHVVRDAWGASWAEVSEALRRMHPEPETWVRPVPTKPEGKLRRGLRRVWGWVSAISVAMDFLVLAILVVMVVLGSGISLFRCIRDALP